MSDLDARIRSEIDDAVTQIKGCDPDQFDAMATDTLRDALFAVLDLHKPMPDEVDRHGGPICTCLPDESDPYIAHSYPCATVRVIAEKLGVELPGA